MINYNNLAKSIDFYEGKGFKRIETPWTVAEDVVKLTAPQSAVLSKLIHNSKCLVGSAEQGFLYLALKGFLAPGRYQSCGPCFRDDLHDIFHTKYFMKNELIDTERVDMSSVGHLVTYAYEFFSNIDGIIKDHLYIEKTSDISFDIMYRDVELGSYGLRECSYLKWVYATGCAEPRLSTVVTKEKNGWIK